ncbi:tRNA uridine-5-carboxymethylaminomethyl(34) synthesis enzyme MnmG [Poseidonocella sedimentorum]|uniref:tRNA uridine-5-carboxymethylaminomethyl(34) synthesis enzyme MnmG n=1 Tax=Poseidonocella sedimentorum TaxID=871652 RepID=UPI0015A51031|nr:tRNA uridine-5-carboxymethylaminomethyl(34) synthesis enzyme MnmG [Poseidonocella sedimentorum]
MFHVKHYDVIVVGGGHAGCEAAHAATRMGAITALVTMKRDDLGVMSCNPAIGGLGKGHLVREIDALDGVMGRVADLAGIQFRLLNRRKGPAVQGPRAQIDRSLYKAHMRTEMESLPILDLLEGEVAELLFENSKLVGVGLTDNAAIYGKTVVLTTGTFLGGTVHIGDKRYPAGRMGSKSSIRLAAQIRDLFPRMGRLKTGTPPRLDGKTINWEVLESQPGDDVPTYFSFLTNSTSTEQVSCGITHTNGETHDIIRENLDRSAMYGGHIEGTGPRYCPSIEDKVVRFSDKSSHQVFLEPEGLSTDVVYPNGISTSLPEDVQESYVSTLKGLDNVRIIQPGYAIEYDYCDPTTLSRTLEHRDQEGLFLAGQINGTTGYEEAAAQGLVSGLNAAAKALSKDTVTFLRSDSYIGVMLDDLTTRSVTEPYRMFTSRAEFRLRLRADNADQRLTEFGKLAGCVGEARWTVFAEKKSKLDSAKAIMENKTYSSKELEGFGISVKNDGKKRSTFDLLSFPNIEFPDLLEIQPELSSVEFHVREQIERDAMYANYLVRQERDAEALQRDEQRAIPVDMDYESLSGLSGELRSKLVRVRPASLGQAARIEGMTPAALTLILSVLKRSEAERRA